MGYYPINKHPDETGQDTRKGFIEFDLNERGKMRHIKSVHFSERVVQKSLCMHALYPMIAKSLIYDNCASQTGKVIKKPCRKSITTERRKLKKQAKLLAAGTVTLDEIKQSYEFWRGSRKKRNARRTVQSMDKLFKNLFSTKGEENDNTNSNRTTETIQNLRITKLAYAT